MGGSLGLTAVLVFSAAVFSTLALALFWEVSRDWIRRRQVAKRMAPVMQNWDRVGEGTPDEIVRQFSGDEGLLSELAQSVPGVRRTEMLLREARTAWHADTFYILTIGLGFGFGGTALFATRMWLVAVIAAMVGASLPYFYLRRKRTKRLRAFEEEFPESIDLLTRAIRAGHPLASGMRMVGDEGPTVVAEEFRQAFEEQRFGLPFQDALLGIVDRVNLVDVRIFAIAVLIQREVGGNLAEILDNLAKTIRDRFYIRRQLRVYTAQGRLSGYALAALPVGVALITFLVQPEYMSLLFTNLLGRFLVVSALTMQLIGVLWIRKIINIDI